MAEFVELKEAIKFAKVGGLTELVVPPSYIKFLSFDKVEVTIGYFNVGGKVDQRKSVFELPRYLLPIISRLFTSRSTTYSLLTSLSNDLAVKCLNDIFSKYAENVYILHAKGTIRCMVPEKYVFIPNEYVLNGIISKETEANVVNILMCDQTRIMRMVYVDGETIKTQAGPIKKAVAVLNSEIGMLDYKTVKKASVVAYPAVWYMDTNKCAILNGVNIPFVAVNQMGKKKTDILLDFMVDIAMSKLYDVIINVHDAMVQERPNNVDGLVGTIRNVFKLINPAYYKQLQTSIDRMSVYSLYMDILNRSSMYTPQFRIKIEKLCGQIYGGFYDTTRIV